MDSALGDPVRDFFRDLSRLQGLLQGHHKLTTRFGGYYKAAVSTGSTRA